MTLGRPEKDPGGSIFGVLGEALGRRRRVQFRYHTIDRGATETRTLHPYGLGLADGNWHVVGYDEGRDGLRNFRVDRIRGKVSVIDKTDDAYAVPAEFDAQRLIGAPEFELADGPEVDVPVELDPTATWLMERNVKASAPSPSSTGGAVTSR